MTSFEEPARAALPDKDLCWWVLQDLAVGRRDCPPARTGSQERERSL